MFGYCTNMVDLKTLNLHGVSPTMLILSESIQNMHHFGVSPITTVFFDKEIRVIEIHRDYVFHNYSQIQSCITPNLYGVSLTVWRSSQSTWKRLHYGVSSVTIA